MVLFGLIVKNDQYIDAYVLLDRTRGSTLSTMLLLQLLLA